MGEEAAPSTDKSPERYGAAYPLTLTLAGSAIGILAVLAIQNATSWTRIAIFAAVLLAGWSVLLFLHDRAAAARQRRYAGLQRARLFAERLVIYDRETGLYADWYFRLRLQEELVRSKRFGQSCSVLLVEATQGRLSPEREKELFESIARTFRQTDLVAHLGSLRFVALLPNTDAAGATIARERLIARLPPGEVQAGLATYPADGGDWRELLAAASASSADLYGSPAPAWQPETTSSFVPNGEESAA